MDIEQAKDLLPEADVDFLVEKAIDCDLLLDGGKTIITFHNFALSDKYFPTMVELRVEVPAGYPAAALDMFWTLPWVTLTGGAHPQATTESPRVFCDSSAPWQRWSRHFQGWRSGVDSIRTFYAGIRQEIAKGI